MSTRTDLVDIIAADSGITKKAANELLEKVTTAISVQLFEDGESVLPGFGRFKVITRPERKGFNPKSGQPITIPQRNVVKFHTFPSFTTE